MPQTIYTIGHSVRKFEDFFEMIEWVGFDILVDVRSKPYSRRQAQFNKNQFIEKLWEKYLWMWEVLGGFDDEISDKYFKQWIKELLEISEEKIVVIMCSEKDHKKCHRFYKITPQLLNNSKVVLHL